MAGVSRLTPVIGSRLNLSTRSIFRTPGGVLFDNRPPTSLFFDRDEERRMHLGEGPQKLPRQHEHCGAHL